MADLKIPKRGISDRFNLQDFKDDFNALNEEIDTNKSLTDSEIAKLKETTDTWETFKNNGGTINGAVHTQDCFKVTDVGYLGYNNDGHIDLVSTQNGKKVNIGAKDDQGNILCVSMNGKDAMLQPNTDATISLGNASNRFKDLHLQGMIYGSVIAAGDWTSYGCKNSSGTNTWYTYSTPDGDSLIKGQPGAEHFYYSPREFSPVWNTSDKSLGSEESRWANIYLKGSNLSDNGFTKLPNGLIMQWATLNLPPTDEKSIYLPISFPNKLIAMYATPRGNRANGVWSIPWWDNGTIKVWNGSNIEINYYVLAIGY